LGINSTILRQSDGILVGQRTNPDELHIVTAIDVVNFLHQVAMPFVLIVEIELSIRQMINSCVTHEELQTCISNCLEQFYTPESMPTLVNEMTFNDYVQVIGDGRNWHHFERFFGNAQGQRRRTRTMLQKIGELRNDVFHFRRQIEEENLRFLSNKRDLLEQKAVIFEGGQEQTVEAEA